MAAELGQGYGSPQWPRKCRFLSAVPCSLLFKDLLRPRREQGSVGSELPRAALPHVGDPVAGLLLMFLLLSVSVLDDADRDVVSALCAMWKRVTMEKEN
jgi:hypothetical protein